MDITADAEKRQIVVEQINGNLKFFMARVGANDVTADDRVWVIAPQFDFESVVDRVKAIIAEE